MAWVEISDDSLAWLESQLSGSLAAIQRVRAQLHKGAMPDWNNIPMASVKLPHGAKPDAPPAAPKSLAPPQQIRQPKPNVRLLVPEAVATLPEEFSIGAVKKALQAKRNDIPDSAIRRTLEEMTERGELVLSERNTGRSGSKYRRITKSLG